MNELHEQIEVLLKSAPNHETALEQILCGMLAKFNSETGTIQRLHKPTQWLRLVAYHGKDAL